jgi:hypothetical protein
MDRERPTAAVGRATGWRADILRINGNTVHVERHVTGTPDDAPAVISEGGLQLSECRR